MDFRDIVRSHTDMVLGHKQVYETLNVKKENQRFSKDPLKKLYDFINDSQSKHFYGDLGKYNEAYYNYSLCLKRVLSYISIVRRVDSGFPHFPSLYKKQLIAKYNEAMLYCKLDYQNLIIHSCILLDRVISISRRFFNSNDLPSFTSFNKHKKFIIKNSKALTPYYNEYIQYIKHNTDWFEIPLKVLRDKYIMHLSEKHISLLAREDTNKWDLVMLTIIFSISNQNKLFERPKIISFSPRRLARDIESFLIWFAEYSIKKLKKR